MCTSLAADADAVPSKPWYRKHKKLILCIALSAVVIILSLITTLGIIAGGNNRPTEETNATSGSIAAANGTLEEGASRDGQIGQTVAPSDAPSNIRIPTSEPPAISPTTDWPTYSPTNNLHSHFMP